MYRVFLRPVLALASLLTTAMPVDAAGPYSFHTLTPCRVADTRFSGGPMAALETRTFTFGGICGIPTTAKAVALTVTIVAPPTDGYLTLYPTGVDKPLTASMTFQAGIAVLSNSPIVPLSNDAQTDAFLLLGIGSAHLVFDVTGYFE